MELHLAQVRPVTASSCFLHAVLCLQLDIKADRFVRTTQKSHEKLVQALLQRIHDRGDIYKAAYEGRYCVGCEKYMDDSEMEPGHICPSHQTECKLRQEENYFFQLSK